MSSAKKNEPLTVLENFVAIASDKLRNCRSGFGLSEAEESFIFQQCLSAVADSLEEAVEEIDKNSKAQSQDKYVR